MWYRQDRLTDREDEPLETPATPPGEPGGGDTPPVDEPVEDSTTVAKEVVPETPAAPSRRRVQLADGRTYYLTESEEAILLQTYLDGDVPQQAPVSSQQAPAAPAAQPSVPQPPGAGTIPFNPTTQEPDWDAMEAMQANYEVSQGLSAAGVSSLEELDPIQAHQLQSLSELRSKQAVQQAKSEYLYQGYQRQQAVQETQNWAKAQYDKFCEEKSIAPEFRTMFEDHARRAFGELQASGRQDPGAWEEALQIGHTRTQELLKRFVNAQTAAQASVDETTPGVEPAHAPGVASSAEVVGAKPTPGSAAHDKMMADMVNRLRPGS